jgi:hypothetical protein
MKTSDKQISPADRPAAPMTLEQMRMKMVVNTMKIDIEKYRLQNLLAGAMPGASQGNARLSRLEEVMKYASIAAATYRLAKKGARFFKSIRNKS